MAPVAVKFNDSTAFNVFNDSTVCLAADLELYV